MFIPKLIGTLFVCLMVYFVTICADKFINRNSFKLFGYYNDMVSVFRYEPRSKKTGLYSCA
ncbi:hypothetical protein DPMN_143358 [Dreissena polymorpha]|uniref:Uncharacterized protein n=1 Tax=Dreissena polymorpha TaxID=45954 RepID=A0A9D4GH16_DREPO|nr:hypothetical protein DPMN_143358 [Dreissena polymorpha]